MRSGFNFFFKLFNEKHSCRAVFYILLVYVHIIGHWFFCKMGKTRTIEGANFIYGTHIRFQVQELAGL